MRSNIWLLASGLRRTRRCFLAAPCVFAALVLLTVCLWGGGPIRAGGWGPARPRPEDTARAYWSAVLKGSATEAHLLLTSDLRRVVPVEALRAYAQQWQPPNVPADTREWRIERVTPVQAGTDRAVCEVKLQHSSRLRAYMKREDGEWRIASPTGVEPFDWAPRTRAQREIVKVVETFVDRFHRGDTDGAYDMLTARSQSNLSRERLSRTMEGARRSVRTRRVLLGAPEPFPRGNVKVVVVEVRSSARETVLSDAVFWLTKEAGRAWRIRFGKADPPDLGRAGNPGDPADRRRDLRERRGRFR